MLKQQTIKLATYDIETDEIGPDAQDAQLTLYEYAIVLDLPAPAPDRPRPRVWIERQPERLVVFIHEDGENDVDVQVEITPDGISVEDL